jgi:hypothetical protein
VDQFGRMTYIGQVTVALLKRMAYEGIKVLVVLKLLPKQKMPRGGHPTCMTIQPSMTHPVTYEPISECLNEGGREPCQ